jgi:hypothetical protein
MPPRQQAQYEDEYEDEYEEVDAEELAAGEGTKSSEWCNRGASRKLARAQAQGTARSCVPVV